MLNYCHFKVKNLPEYQMSCTPTKNTNDFDSS